MAGLLNVRTSALTWTEWQVNPDPCHIVNWQVTSSLRNINEFRNILNLILLTDGKGPVRPKSDS